MRGSPILRLVLVLAALLLLLIPLMHLTRPATAAAPAAVQASPQAANTVVHLELTSTRAPFAFELLYLGRGIWSGESTTTQARRDVAIAFPKEGVDLELKGSWSGGESLSAIKLGVAAGEAQPVEKTAWATKAFDEVLTFP